MLFSSTFLLSLMTRLIIWFNIKNGFISVVSSFFLGNIMSALARKSKKEISARRRYLSAVAQAKADLSGGFLFYFGVTHACPKHS
jgi:hypothetical protein